MITTLMIFAGVCLGFMTAIIAVLILAKPIEDNEEYAYIECDFSEFESDYANGRDYKRHIKKNNKIAE